MQIRAVISVCFVLILLAGCVSIGTFNSAEREFETGLGFFNRGMYDEAIPHFQRATELDLNYVDAYIYLGRSHLSMARWAQAVPPLRTAFRLSPARTQGEILDILIDALLGAALTEFKLGNYPGAISHLQEGLQLRVGSDTLMSQLVAVFVAQGRELLSQGRHKDATSSFSEAIRLSPDETDAYLGLAEAFLKEGDFFKALDAAEKALQIDPTNRDAESLRRHLKVRPDGVLLP
jgi:tetratricopeptide (TPR) repeat protein